MSARITFPLVPGTFRCSIRVIVACVGILISWFASLAKFESKSKLNIISIGPTYEMKTGIFRIAQSVLNAYELI
ncbi:hypothetical protein ACLKA6_006433 [Drosophila palustris]